MQNIIVTYIKEHKEIDLQLQNHIQCQQIIEKIIDWQGIDIPWGNDLFDLECSFDFKNWYKVDKTLTFEQAEIWDGAYIRLSEGGASALPSIRDFERDENEEDVEYVYSEGSDYIWKVID